MKTIGIIAAMEEEIEYVKSVMEVKAAKGVANMDFYVGVFAGKSVVASKCGIGKVNASICAQVMIDHFAVDYIINIGTAGSINSELNVGDIVISTDVCHHDFDVTAFGYQQCVIPRMSESFFKADESLVELAYKCAESLESENKVFKARVASGDVFVSTAEAKNKIWTTTKAYCTEMEGAAIAQTCYLNHLPFVIIREVSDKADEKASISFDTFVQNYLKDYGRLIELIVAEI